MLILTLMTGVLYIFADFARLGFIANFLSQPILTGYLNGIALIIMVGQLQKLFGYSGEAEDFFPKLIEFAGSLDQTHLPTLILGLGMLAALVVLRRVAPKLPAARGIVFAHARAKRNLSKFFKQGWLMKRRALRMEYDFPTVKSAVRAFNGRANKAAAPEHHASQA